MWAYSTSCPRRPALLSAWKTSFGRTLSSQVVVESFMNCYMNFATSYPVTSVSQCLGTVHDELGLSWTSVIVSSAVALRMFATLPAHITAQKTAAKRRLLFQDMENDLLPELKRNLALETRGRSIPEKVLQMRFKREVQHIMKEQVIERNCAATKMYLPILLQIPIWMTMTVALRNQITMLTLSHKEGLMRFAELRSEGVLWFSDLTVPDPILLLPLFIGFNLILVQETSSRLYSEQNVISKKRVVIATTIARLLPFVIVPVCFYVPSGLTLYWAISGASGTIINALLMLPVIRRKVGIPLIPQEPQNPFQVIKQNFLKDVTKLNFFKKLKQ